MIPRIIHYVWLGGAPLPELAEQCISSWHKHMPDWEYKMWTEASLTQAIQEPNPGPCPKGKGEKYDWLDYMPIYVREAYEARKYAFVSDYVRLWALEQYGGVYLDTDVEVLKSLEPLLNDSAFMGFEESKEHLPATCVIGCEPHCQWVRDMLALYKDAHFLRSDGSLDMTTNVQRMGSVMLRELMNEGVNEEKYWKSIQFVRKWGMRIYTHNYFSPITSTRVMRKTHDTYAVHHFAGSWVEKTRSQLVKDWILTHILGRKLTDKLVQIKRKWK